MKKFISYFLLSSTFFLGSNVVHADEYDSFYVKHDGNVSVNVWGINSGPNTKTLLSTIEMGGNTNFYPQTSYISSITGELMLKNSDGDYKAYNWKSNSWRDVKTSDLGMSGGSTFSVPVSYGGGSNTVKIGDVDGDPIISKKANGEIHFGKNSLITTMEDKNGVQPLYAKDDAGNRIPINIEGSKLLINGRDVEQSINNVGALSAALTGLPTVPTDTTLACGLGTGTHGGDFAFSGGCASKVNEKLAINYAASMTMPVQDYAGDFEDTFSARAGFVWKLGKSVKPTQISMQAKEQMEDKINSLREKNEEILSKNQKLENKLSTLLARLERLEKVALSESKSTDLATIQLP